MMPPPLDPTTAGNRRGVMLVVVLVVIVLLSVSVLAFTKFMLAERRGTNQSLRQRQVRLLAESGVEYLRIFLTKEQSDIEELGGLYENPDEFLGHLVTDGSISMSGRHAGAEIGLQTEVDRRDIGRFSVITPLLSEDDLLTGDGYRYGLEDESTKINLRWIIQTETQQPGMGRSMLLRLPGVTEEIADSLLDWLDEDSEPREFGAEDDYYAELDPPYYTRNGIPDSIDELLLVRGITPKLLYGIDWNRNGVVDLGEPDESTLEEFDVDDGSLNLGLASYLTLDSRESIATPDGLEKINVNMEDLDELRSLLEERLENQSWVDYIISYRQQSSSGSGNGSSGNPLSLLSQATGQGSSGGTEINSLLDLVDSGTTNALSLSNLASGNSQPGQNEGQGEGQSGEQAGSGGNSSSSSLQSPFSSDPAEMNEYLPVLYDNLMISDKPVVGRININQASRTVLYLFAGQDDDLTASALLLGSQLDATSQIAASTGYGQQTSFGDIDAAEIIEQILAERVVDPNLIEDPEMKYPFWPYTRGIITDLETMKKLEPYFCTQGSVFKAQIVGRFDELSPVVRLEAWLDASEPGKPAKVIRIRELTELGPGYAAEILGADEYSHED